MAANFTVSVDEVSCPVCQDIFTCPVVLPCSHSLCKGCLRQCWTAGFQKCPLCKRACPPGTDPPVNLALKNLCERFHLEQDVSETLCSLHNEKLRLFCLVDKQPICADCVPDLHDRHKCCHLKVAVHSHKMKMQAALKHLQEKLEDFKKISDTRDQKLHRIKSQVQQTEKQIKEEFQELHQFLRREETARIAALRAEEAQRSQTLSSKMEELVRKMEALSATVKAIEQEMGKDDVSFLQNYNATMKQTQRSVEDPDPVSGVLIDVAKHLGNLKFLVWEKMMEIVTYSPVILDPNTGGPSLVLSKDLTSLLTGNGSYSYMDHIPLFGSQGFISGKHQWDVEFPDSTVIDLGIVKESQKERFRKYISSYVCDQRYHGLCEMTNNKNTIRRGMVRMRVLLDCDQKTLALFDVYGQKTFGNVCRYTFTGKVFPLFCFACIDSKSQLNLKILSARTTVMVQENNHASLKLVV